MAHVRYVHCVVDRRYVCARRRGAPSVPCLENFDHQLLQPVLEFAQRLFRNHKSGGVITTLDDDSTSSDCCTHCSWQSDLPPSPIRPIPMYERDWTTVETADGMGSNNIVIMLARRGVCRTWSKLTTRFTRVPICPCHRQAVFGRAPSIRVRTKYLYSISVCL